ncbi:MAG: DUF167 family protein [Cardiobacteriaceae bacterium]|nr:DUF167 family protein [Cardiobacteriaceae bacterium]
MSHTAPAHWQGNTLILAVKITARASRDQYQGIHDGRIKLAITAAPEDGKANAYLCKWLAKTFAVGKRDVSVQSGERSPLKIIAIANPQTLPTDWALPVP